MPNRAFATLHEPWAFTLSLPIAAGNELQHVSTTVNLACTAVQAPKHRPVSCTATARHPIRAAGSLSWVDGACR